MSAPFRVIVLTPERAVFEGEAVHLLAPGIEGYLGILAHHAPLITALHAGTLSVRTPDGREHAFEVGGGFLEVGDNQARVLADDVRGEASA